ncbi:MAG: DUF1045 domain-containing protein [Pseudomonadota bacterium]
MEFARYAVYFCPRPETALARFGREWLGYDCETGESLARTSDHLLENQISQPRRYGFHATLKPPFRLSAGVEYDDFAAAVSGLAGDLHAFTVDGLVLKELGSFLALVPRDPSDALSELAFKCVRDLDRFRAPLNSSEIAQKAANGLSPYQEHLLFTWGYPYVGDEFRFHMTLTGQLTRPEMRRAQTQLTGLVAEFERSPVEIADLCICGDPGDKQPLRVVKRFSLKVHKAPE